jgi:hypothetical protein
MVPESNPKVIGFSPPGTQCCALLWTRAVFLIEAHEKFGLLWLPVYSRFCFHESIIILLCVTLAGYWVLDPIRRMFKHGERLNVGLKNEHAVFFIQPRHLISFHVSLPLDFPRCFAPSISRLHVCWICTHEFFSMT